MTKADSPKAPAKLETITLKAFIHCEGCRRKIRRIIRVLDGIEDVEVDSATGKVTVTGSGLDLKTILQRLQKYKKQAEVWPSANASPNATAKSAGGNQPKPANNNNTNPDTNAKKKKNADSATGGQPEAAASNNESKQGGGKKEAAAVAEKDEDGGTPASEQKPNKSKGQNAIAEAGDENTPPPQGGGGGGGGSKKGKKGGNAGNNNNNNGGGGGGGDGGNSGGNGVASQQPPLHIIHDQPNANAPTSSVTVSANKSLAPSYDSVQTGYLEYNSVDYATHMFSDENANNCSIM